MGRTTKGDRSAHHTRGASVQSGNGAASSILHAVHSSGSSVIQTSIAQVHATDGIEGAIATLARNPGGGLIVMPGTFNVTNRDLIFALAIRYGVPAVSNNPIFADSGSLITYGVDFAELMRQAAGFINRILKGDSPADLPVQSPTKFNLAVNLKTAKALGLTVLPTLLDRADKVIE